MRYQKTPHGYMVRLQKGEEIHASLTRFMKEKKFGGGSVTGLGAVTDVGLGYFHLNTKQYDRHEYKDEYELVSLTGNLSLVDGQPLLHAHVVISGSDMAAISGHLFAATIAVTGEFAITVSDTPMNRALDPETGLKLLDLPEDL
ncbi:MAG: DNA-binding protein [candidate division Zixibacteria bacterium]|nr:DNA-binding protein [candidate division Zixibacteria bacterium]